MGMRLEDVRPTFDLFSLGKVLWAMVSGRPKMQLWYWQDPRFDLEKQYAADDRMRWINRLLSGLVVGREANVGWTSAMELLSQIDAMLPILANGGQVVQRNDLRRCSVCGRGPYREFIGNDDYRQRRQIGLDNVGAKVRVYECEQCGHLLWLRMDRNPPAWGEVAR